MSKQATVVRMVTPDHLCPWGVKAKDLLRRGGFAVEDRHLTTKDANAAYKKENGYDETPQIFVEGKRVGGYDALRTYLGKGPDPDEGESYQPIIAVFSVALGMAVMTVFSARGVFDWLRIAELFVAFSMCVLGILKLQNLQSFATGFVQYDLLARRYVPYAYLHTFIEAVGGVLMIGEIATLVIAPAVLFVSTVGAGSVFKAMYLEKRDVNCACVGGSSRVPGFVSLTENLL
jgi:glutaredoxin